MEGLLSEVEILDRVKADWTKPVVSFLCTTYNQESYIGNAIKGFLEQKTSFPYEILIHDDNSMDGTKDIIEKYRLKYPNIIRCIYQTENKYSKGFSTLAIAAKECKCDYIALCEGDDYWINENKIENQFDFMKSDDSISMIVSPGNLECEGEILSELIGFHGKEPKVITAQNVLDIADQFAPTASYFLKKDYLIKSRELFIEAPVGDLFIELYSAIFGKLVYFPEVGSVYRIRAKNSWSERMVSDLLINKILFIESMQNIIDYSKSIKGFENLVWDVKLSDFYFSLAIVYLNKKDINNFKKNIYISNFHRDLNGARKIIYCLRNQTFLLFSIRKTVIYFRNIFRRFFSSV